MGSMNPLINEYLAHGCGRCSLYDTPECKVFTWQEQLKQLRLILSETELKDELKWKQPCYTINGKNVLIMACFKDFAFIAFFKGALLKDPENLLVFAGENSHSSKRMEFTSVEQIIELEPVIKQYVEEAIEIEKSGKKVDTSKKKEMKYPEELVAKFEEDPRLEEAFEALTPGRKRGYILYFTGAKQSATRTNRIEKYAPKIMSGKGFHD